MHIEIHIFPDSFSIAPQKFTNQMDELFKRIREHIQNATVNAKGFALGKTTLLDDKSGYVLATIDIKGSGE